MFMKVNICLTSSLSIFQVKHYTSFEEMKKRDNFTNTKRADNPNVNKKVAKSEGGFFRKG